MENAKKTKKKTDILTFPALWILFLCREQRQIFADNFISNVLHIPKKDDPEEFNASRELGDGYVIHTADVTTVWRDALAVTMKNLGFIWSEKKFTSKPM